MQKRNAIVQVEIDTVIVNPEQAIDFDTLEPEKPRLILLIHCYAPHALFPVTVTGA